MCGPCSAPAFAWLCTARQGTHTTQLIKWTLQALGSNIRVEPDGMQFAAIFFQEDAEPETINHASGDEVDTSLIIPGGRRARKGRPQIGGQAQYKYQQKLADSDEDSW